MYSSNLKQMVRQAACAVVIISAAGVTGSVVAQDRPDTRPDRQCRENALPVCRTFGEPVRFDISSGGGNGGVGTADPLWQSDRGTPMIRTDGPYASNGNANWITPGGSSSGNYVYSANVWVSQDPYFYDSIAMNLSVGADNQVVAVRVNGVDVHTGNGGNRDFDTANFDTIAHLAQTSGAPWRRGCNTVEIVVYNSGNITAMSVDGQIQAMCTRCTVPRRMRETARD